MSVSEGCKKTFEDEEEKREKNGHISSRYVGCLVKSSRKKMANHF